jgi:hypothetical protein
MHVVYPALAAFIALVLYFKAPRAYVGFTLWIWFLTPEIRRLIDFRSGYTEPNLALLAPFFVASIGGLAIVTHARRGTLIIPTPLLFCGTSVLYGFAVSVFLGASNETIFAFLNWLSPILFSLYLVLNYTDYPAIRKTFETNLAIGAGFMGAYGVYQFVTAPPWDVYWLNNISIGLIDPSFGQPVPFGLRVWSTLNSAGPFANVMMACLLLLFVTPNRFKLPFSVFGYLGFLLSSVRTAWLGFLIGLALLMRGQKPATIVKLIGSLLLLVACLVPVISSPELAPVLGDRVKTFSNLGQDESFRERQDMYQIMFEIIRQQPFGHGLHNGEIVRNLVVDSGFLIMLFSLGWAGTVLYLAGVVIFLFTKQTTADDKFPWVMKAICIAYLAQLVGGIMFVNVTGAMFWMCYGMATCAESWHNAQTYEQLQLAREAHNALPAGEQLALP